MNRISLCFVAHNAFGAVSGTRASHAGGIERQQALMAKWLAARGHDISMITWAPEREGGDGGGSVRMVHLCRKSDGIPGVRFFHPRWTSLNRALRRADADIYYYNCGDGALGQIAMWTARHGRHLVYSVASDVDCQPDFPNLRRGYDKWLYRHGLLRCDSIIVQSITQQQLLEKHFARHSTVLPMPSDGAIGGTEQRSNDRSSVLWIGRLSPEKRPDWLLDIAELLPDRKFAIVGAANKDSAYASEVIERARRLPNVRLLGRIPYDRMAQCYSDAAIVCSTSVYEGFPNVYLEAWSQGIPVVATCDPDGIIAARGLGRVGRNVRELADGIEMLLSSQELYDRTGKMARDYYETNHRTDVAMRGFVNHFRDVSAAKNRCKT